MPQEPHQDIPSPYYGCTSTRLRQQLQLDGPDSIRTRYWGNRHLDNQKRNCSSRRMRFVLPVFYILFPRRWPSVSNHGIEFGEGDVLYVLCCHKVGLYTALGLRVTPAVYTTASIWVTNIVTGDVVRWFLLRYMYVGLCTFPEVLIPQWWSLAASSAAALHLTHSQFPPNMPISSVNAIRNDPPLHNRGGLYQSVER